MIETRDMWLVYVDQHGENHYQHWDELVTCGTLVEPDSADDDMEMVGWTTTPPA